MKLLKDNRGIAHLAVFIVFAVTVLGFVGYTAWNAWQTNKKQDTTQVYQSNKKSETKPDPYAGWKTYKNAQWKFSIRYPSGWKITKDEDETGIVLETNDLKYKDFSNVESGAFVYIPYHSNVVSSAKSYEDLLKCEACNPNRTIIDNYDLMLDQLPAKARTLRLQGAHEDRVVYKYPTLTNGTDYSFIILISDSDTFSEFDNEFRKILGTFELTD